MGVSTKKNLRITIRVDPEIFDLISDFSKYFGVSKSEWIRYAITFTKVLHDPSLTLGDAVKKHYLELLRKDPNTVLKLPIIDVLKPLKQLEDIVKEVEVEIHN